jgi:hypothetical protein
MADLSSGVSGTGKAKTGGTADQGTWTEGSEEDEWDEHDRLKTFTACGRESVKPGV